MKKLIYKIACTILFVLIIKQGVSQSDVSGLFGHIGTAATQYCGWDASTLFPLEIKHEANYPINFYTNAGAGTFLNQKMIITSSTNPLTDGFVGIGNSGFPSTPTNFATFPNFRLDVDNGDININNNAYGYRMYDQYSSTSKYILWNNNNSDNLYVGIDAGNAALLPQFNTSVGYKAGTNDNTGIENTSVGSNAGEGITLGSENVNIGKDAGKFNDGENNTIVGYAAGYLSAKSTNNVFVGSQAAYLNIPGSSNTCVGDHSGYQILGADNNSFFGNQSGYGNVAGNDNVAVGYQSGNAFTGRYTTLLGAQTNSSMGGILYSTAVGYNAIVTNSYNMILGDNDINVGIGLSGNAAGPQAKLDVKNDFTIATAQPVAGLFTNTGTTSLYSTTAVLGLNDAGSANTNYGGQFFAHRGINNIGVYSETTQPTSNDAYGVLALSKNANHINSAVWGDASSSTGKYNNGGVFLSQGTNTGINNGVLAEVKDGASNYGVYSIVTSPGNPLTYPMPSNIAIYGNAKPSPFSFPVALSYAGFFDGDVWINGPRSGAANFVATISDQIFKTQIDSLTGALDIIKSLKPKTYFLDTANIYGMNFSNQKQIGFIAEEVEAVFPLVVQNGHKPETVDSSGTIVTPSVDYKALKYEEFIPLLTRGLQELSSKNDSLKSENTKQDSINTSLQNQVDSLKANNTSMQSQINTLSDLINECCNRNHSPQQMNNNNNGGNGNNNDGNKNNTTSQTDVKLTDGQSIILDQNSPNPFAEQTTIGYFLPDDVSKAQMLFYNAGGKLIQSVELTQKGKGQLNVFAQDLTNGLYTYTLVVDGKIFETKRMVKQ